ncbi:DUF883 family protein [Mesorhizobium xinjiangense]|uniref:DUF883 family protein n=1 Tax=Mesorhizobium xinjiangense TaxID=2678685 RepID=UPI0018DB7BA0|nr:DUF883 family protein [Mesorhizobium xinjiangense]
MAATQSKSAKSVGGEGTAEDFEHQIAILKEELENVKSQLARSGGRSMAAARKAAAGGMDRLRHQGETALEDFKGSAHDIEDRIGQTIREKPVTSLAIAAGIGFLCALLAKR